MATKFYKLVDGIYHSQEMVKDPKTGILTKKQHLPGDIIESELDLVEMFKNKFELVTTPVIKEEVKEEVKEDKKSKKKKESKGEEAEPDFGKDVTDKFEKAEGTGASIFKKKDEGYTVVKDGKAIEGSPFTERKDVVKALKAMA